MSDAPTASPMHVRMAKANREDLDGAYELSTILEALDRGHYPARETDEDPPTFFDDQDEEHLQYLHERLLAIAQKISLFRVVGGLETLLSDSNAVVDPDDDCIALHPRFKAACADAERWRFWVEAAIEDEDDGARRAEIVKEPFPNDVAGFNAALDAARARYEASRSPATAPQETTNG